MFMKEGTQARQTDQKENERPPVWNGTESANGGAHDCVERRRCDSKTQFAHYLLAINAN